MARLDAMERSQRKQDQMMEEITASMARMSTTMHHGFERLERIMVARDGDDRRGVHHDQRLEKLKVDIPYFDGGHPYD